MKKITFFICFFIFAPAAFGWQYLSVNIKDMTAKADKIFRGRCESANVETMYKNGKPYLVTNYVFSIASPEDFIKGEPTGRVEFKQWGASRAESMKRKMPFAVSPASFEPGKEYVLFLSKESPSTGVKSTIGFAQGVLNVIYSADGSQKVVNNFGNKNFYKGLPATDIGVTKALKAGNVDVKNPPSGGPVDYNDFKSMVKGLQ